MECPSVGPSNPRSTSYNGAQGVRGGRKIRCPSRVAMPTRDPLTELAAEVLRLEAEVLQEEAGVLLLDARASELFARMARVEARCLELGLVQPKPLRLRASEPEPTLPMASAPAGPVPDDRFVDQRDGLVPKALFLRLAREGAFPSSKIGKRVVARWGDVRAAIEARQRKACRSLPHTNRDRNRKHADLDALRRQLSLNPKRGG
jgi:hypothetical protein